MGTDYGIRQTPIITPSSHPATYKARVRPFFIPMHWPWKHEPIPSSSIEERRINEYLFLVSRRLKLCEDTLRTNPDDPDALYTKGVFLAKIQEYRRALRCLQRVGEIDPSYPGLWRTKATIHTKLGELDKARSCRARSVDDAA